MAYWKYIIKIGDLAKRFQSKEIPIQEVARELAKRLRAKFPVISDYLSEDCDEELTLCIENLEDLSKDPSRDANDYDDVLADLYDWADENRLWLDSFQL